MSNVKRIMLVIICLLSLAFPINHTFAQERTKATISIIFINSARTTYDDELTNKINVWFDGKVNGIYNVIPSNHPLAKLKELGFEDIGMAEKKDLLDAFSDIHTDYIIFAQLQPFIRKERITLFTYGKDMTANMVLKILDVSNAKYLYNGKFIIKGSDTTTDWFIGNKSVALKAIDSVLVEMGEIISFKLPLQ